MEEINEENSERFQESGEEVNLDPERQAQAREYARKRRRWMLVQLVLTLALVILFWITGWSGELKAALIAEGITNPYGLTGLYVFILILASNLLLLPLRWWTGYVLPHRYDLSTQSLASWISDEAKLLGFEILLGIPAAEVIYGLLRSQPNTWWLWAAGFAVLLGVVMSALAPFVVVPLFYKMEPLEDEELVARVRELAERTGTEVSEVDVIDLSSRTTTANAMVMGLGSTKRIAIGDTFYEDYTADEIEAVIAHELGHQVHHDLPIGILVQGLLTLTSFYAAHLTLQWGVERFGFESIADLAALPLVILVFALFSVITLPLVNAFSRWRERKADRFALNIIDHPQAFGTAVTRLSNQNLAEADPPDWVVWLLYDHPPIRERIARAEAYERQVART